MKTEHAIRHIRIYALLVSGLVLVLAGLSLAGPLSQGKTMYVAAAESTAPVFEMSADGELTKAAPIPRGTEVTMTRKTAADADGHPLVGIRKDGARLYIPTENLTENKDAVVLETRVFVRTPATLYENETGPEIAGFAPKGTALEIAGYDLLQGDGTVHMYRVTDGAASSWIYGKYTVLTEGAAKKTCNENGAMDIAKDAKYVRKLYGGSAAKLDYFPHETPVLKGKELCRDARAMYLNAGAAVKDKYFKLACESGVNAVVINIDGGTPAYRSPVMKALCPTAYQEAHYSLEKYQKTVQKYQEAGIYTIGRIACFNDEHFAKDHPEVCIRTDGKPTTWVSAYSREAWYYKVCVAREAVELLGFDEIQFDYVRFPERAYEMSISGNTDFRNAYEEEKAQAIQNFCLYAADQIHEAGAYLSVDVFGECSNGYVSAYGQYWPAISNVVDVISSMPYTDHQGETDTWSHPYSTLYNWAKRSADMQAHIPTPAVARTWITGYNTPYWAPSVDYDYGKLKEQLRALTDAGLEGGFIPWNSSSDFRKYVEYQKIWN